MKMEIFTGARCGDSEALSGHALQCGNMMYALISNLNEVSLTISFRFMNWNLPHMTLRVPRARPYDHFSPFGPAAATPISDVMVKTPSSNPGPSPRNAPSPRDASSPRNAPSPMTVAVRENVRMDRARLFVQGWHTELLKGMSGEEKK
jgi:hypothetical protein